MKWIPLLIIAALVVMLYYYKKNGRVSTAAARSYLSTGALVIDVRNPGEYAAGHLPSAINVPLGDLPTTMPTLVTDPQRVLLLHCQSGLRSGLAVQKLHGLGYKNVFNLGSLQRARDIVGNGGPR